MCGIAGMLSRTPLGDQDIADVRTMTELQAHRGPDDHGLFSDPHCALGHRRLAIIDLSADGHQPFVSDDDRFVMVYNGEIYNYIELREQLEGRGWTFRTRTDTEVLLKAYQEFGAGCLDLLNGMFAFAILDRSDQSLFLARDRFGIKPLYYALTEDRLSFASEIKALRAVRREPLTVNRQALFDYFVFNRTDTFDETFHEEIQRLPKGHWGSFDGGELRLTRWWDPAAIRGDPDEPVDRAISAIEDIMVSSATLRMRSDVEVGTCLSGGLDSSILVGILFAHQLHHSGFSTFSATFPGHPLDESRYVDNLKEAYAFRNHRVEPTAAGALSALQDYVYANDEPTTNASFYSQYEVMRLAKSAGVTVLLDGQGGDEVFAGYQYFHGFHLNGLLRQRRWGKLLHELLRVVVRRQDRSAYQTLAFQNLPHATRKRLLWRESPFIERQFFDAHIEKSRIYNEFFDASDLHGSMVRHFQYKLEHLLRCEDRNSMAFSLEARVPYLDHRLVEKVLSLPADLLIRAGETKHLQKRALGHYTTAKILERKDKIGFGTPTAEWMDSDHWRQLAEDSYGMVCSAFPGIFVGGPVPRAGTERWKVIQLATWLNGCR